MVANSKPVAESLAEVLHADEAASKGFVGLVIDHLRKDKVSYQHEGAVIVI